MTISHVQSFLEQVTKDTSLQEELATAMEAENDRQAVTDLAQSKGYEFSSDELCQEIQARQAELQRQQDELSEEELEAIAGGEVLLVASAVATSVTVAAMTAYSIVQATKVKW
jgi:predicted ribosomally synthesized peptide with nif11-like leader